MKKSKATDKSNILVVYYSFSKNTQRLANEIAKQTGGDIREILSKKEYSFNYNTATKEARNEIARGYCPDLVSGNEPIENYNTIFIGTPNWFKSLAPPVLSFLRKHNFAGKTIVPFCTHGGGGFGEIEKVISRECPHSKLRAGIATGDNISQDEISDWLNKINLRG